ncbi:MAG TPA: PfkB family carbohydrate kinase [Tepidisphaeraceae bacterium]|nr:PfkB family carbohydrate kinase [Tepidisphaeraceae bacterium]
MSPTRKICSLESLLALRMEARAAGKTVVHCHGCFDIVHPGHIMHLQYARSLGDVLIVSVSADTEVGKGIDRPLIPDDLRAASLAALECVDCVYVNPQPTAVELLERLRPDVYVKGKEYEFNFDPRFVAERQVVEQAGGRVVFSSGEVVYSSTALIDSMLGKEAFGDQKVRRYCQRYDAQPSALGKLIARFRGRRVVVIGDYILDRYHFCDATGVAGEGPMMALRHIDCSDFDGGAAIIASHLCGLGAEATLVTALADDQASAGTEMRLRAAGINVQSVRCRRDLVVKNRFLVDQAKLFKVDEGSVMPADSRSQQLLAESIMAAVEGGADAVIFADFGYGAISAGLLGKIMPELRRRVPILTADVSGRQGNLLCFHQVDLLCPTEREVRETLHDFSTGMGSMVWKLLQSTNARQAIITLGKRGLVTFARPRPPENPDGRLLSEYLPALSVTSVDPLGCGDALLATASVALACGASLQQAAYIGAVAAAIEVRQIGNQPITADGLLAAVAAFASSASAASAIASPELAISAA